MAMNSRMEIRYFLHLIYFQAFVVSTRKLPVILFQSRICNFTLSKHYRRRRRRGSRQFR